MKLQQQQQKQHHKKRKQDISRDKPETKSALCVLGICVHESVSKNTRSAAPNIVSTEPQKTTFESSCPISSRQVVHLENSACETVHAYRIQQKDTKRVARHRVQILQQTLDDTCGDPHFACDAYDRDNTHTSNVARPCNRNFMKPPEKEPERPGKVHVLSYST